MYRRFLVVCTLSAAAAAPLTWAQPAPNGAKADPQDASASVPQLVYQSPLANYRAFSDAKVSSWKEANDNVGRIGGWRAYAKEAQAPESSLDATPTAVGSPAPAEGLKPRRDGHDSHKMH